MEVELASAGSFISCDVINSIHLRNLNHLTVLLVILSGPAASSSGTNTSPNGFCFIQAFYILRSNLSTLQGSPVQSINTAVVSTYGCFTFCCTEKDMKTQNSLKTKGRHLSVDFSDHDPQILPILVSTQVFEQFHDSVVSLFPLLNSISGVSPVQSVVPVKP